MSPVLLDATIRGDGKTKEGHRHDKDRIIRGNPPRVFRTRFTGFHILFQTVDIREPGQMIAALSIVSTFSLIATILFFMLARFEKRAILRRQKRFLAAPMFALRLLFLYALVLVVDVMNVWIIFAVSIGHMLGWWLYFVFIKDCLGGEPGHRGDSGGNDDDGGDGKNRRTFDDSSISSQSSDHQQNFWDLA